MPGRETEMRAKRKGHSKKQVEEKNTRAPCNAPFRLVLTSCGGKGPAGKQEIRGPSLQFWERPPGTELRC